jgi:hypothetical protein
VSVAGGAAQGHLLENSCQAAKLKGANDQRAWLARSPSQAAAAVAPFADIQNVASRAWALLGTRQQRKAGEGHSIFDGGLCLASR